MNRDENGYGKWRAAPLTTRYAHRVVWELLVGSIPDGLVVDHQCRNRACCNPAHLRLVTPYVNATENSISPLALNLAKDACHRGHPLAANPCSGNRHCEECQRERQRDYQRKRRDAGDQAPRNPTPEFCKKGIHRWLDGDGNPTKDLYVRPDGVRSCRACSTDRVRNTRRNRRAALASDRRPLSEPKATCGKGHRLRLPDGSYSENLRVRTDGRTECKECVRMAERERNRQMRLREAGDLRSAVADRFP
jgi:hypothetical protein